jgi:hypothetical protein
VFEAAGNIGRKDIQAKVVPSLKAVMRTWWDLVAPDGYGYPWGRTIGAISYMDTIDIIGFLAAHPEFRPAPLAELAAVYHAAWQWLQHDYQPERHLLDMFGFGRGNYSYMTVERQWQQTTAFMAKAAGSLKLLADALKAEKVASFPARPRLPRVARFEWFRQGERAAGVWLVRQGPLRFALPITTGTKSGIADYLPAPHGLPGFAAPVEQLAPALVPQLELADGQLVVAGDGADEIHPDADGKGVRAVWRRWAVVGGEPGKLVEPGLVSEVTWKLEGDALVRRETVTAKKALTVRRFTVLIPSTGAEVTSRVQGGRRIDRFASPDGALEVSLADVSFPFQDSTRATGNSALGRGTRGAIPLVRQLQASGIALGEGGKLEWTLRLQAFAE